MTLLVPSVCVCVRTRAQWEIDGGSHHPLPVKVPHDSWKVKVAGISAIPMEQ